jgi:subtilisin family serine protease
MKWFFEPRRDGDGARHDDDDSAPGLISMPAALLQRHGALVLDPGEAAAISSSPTPRSTVYRARTLLIPGDLLQAPEIIEAISAVLARVGMTLKPPAPDRDRAGRNGPAADVLRQLPRIAVLAPAAQQDGKAELPVVIDAWVALQALRAAAAAREHPALDEHAVRKFALEHLLVGSAITGSPASHGGGVTGSPASHGGGVTGPDSADSYLFSGGDARIPVEVSIYPPVRRRWEHCVDLFGRRPVVAVLDTGVRTHSWLDVRADPSAAGGYTTFTDGFVAVDQVMQDVIHAQDQLTISLGDRPRQLIRYPWDTPITAEPLIGELDTDTGHGTFIAGIVRQVAPDAQVLAVRVMHSDGVVYEGDLIYALRLLADRIALAEEGDLAAMVDVVSLSLGYFDEAAADVAYSSGLRQVIEVLLGMGVAVVAAAGNYSTSRKFYPAAFAAQPTAAGQVPLISVGALNPSGSKALFSDGGRWITAWAAGAAVVSTFPMDINGSRSPEVRMRAHPANEMPAEGSPPGEREALDPDDYSGGFAVWSGTSFSAPLLAAHIARSLLEGAADHELGLRLDLPGAPAATDRAVAALKNLGWQG